MPWSTRSTPRGLPCSWATTRNGTGANRAGATLPASRTRSCRRHTRTGPVTPQPFTRTLEAIRAVDGRPTAELPQRRGNSPAARTSRVSPSIAMPIWVRISPSYSALHLRRPRRWSRSAAEGDQRDRHLGGRRAAVHADQLGHFGRFPPARQHRGVAIADDDNIADAGQVLGPHWPEKASGDGILAG